MGTMMKEERLWPDDSDEDPLVGEMPSATVRSPWPQPRVFGAGVRDRDMSSSC